MALGLRATADDELLGNPVLGQRVAFEDGADPAVANHGDAARVFEQIAETMGDQKDDPAVRGELAHLSKQFVGFLVGQRRIRLVEQKDLGVARDRACDLGALLGRQRAIGERNIGETLDAERLHDFGVGGA